MGHVILKILLSFLAANLKKNVKLYHVKNRILTVLPSCLPAIRLNQILLKHLLKTQMMMIKKAAFLMVGPYGLLLTVVIRNSLCLPMTVASTDLVGCQQRQWNLSTYIQ